MEILLCDWLMPKEGQGRLVDIIIKYSLETRPECGGPLLGYSEAVFVWSAPDCNRASFEVTGGGAMLPSYPAYNINRDPSTMWHSNEQSGSTIKYLSIVTKRMREIPREKNFFIIVM